MIQVKHMTPKPKPKIHVIEFFDTNNSILWEVVKEWEKQGNKISKVELDPQNIKEFIETNAIGLLRNHDTEKIVVLDMGIDSTHPSDPYTVLIFLDERANILKIVEVY